MSIKKPSCPKCGLDDISTVFHAASKEPQYYTCGKYRHGDFPRDQAEHLHRNCRNCQYEWIDPTLDGGGREHQETV